MLMLIAVSWLIGLGIATLVTYFTRIIAKN
jgi:hypothetical protein